eukprot:9494444-Pyramimonas_sp.AAC.1
MFYFPYRAGVSSDTVCEHTNERCWLILLGRRWRGGRGERGGRGHWRRGAALCWHGLCEDGRGRVGLQEVCKGQGSATGEGGK